MRTRSDNSPQENFIKTLSTSLHQMAQPLSIIQASLELALLRQTPSEPFRGVAENVLSELERAVETLRFTSQLARFQQPAADVTGILLSGVLHDVISDLSPTLSNAQVKLVVDHSGREREIQSSPIRLRQLFFYVLQAMQHLSQPADIVHIKIQANASNLKLRISQIPGHSAHPLPRMSDENLATRSLALAEAIVVSAGAEFRIIDSPLVIIADFPVRRQGKQTAVDTGRFTRNIQLAVGSH